MKKFLVKMRFVTILALMFFSFYGKSQGTGKTEPLDPLSFGLVLDDPSMKNVVIKKDVTYLKDDKGELKIDLYSPPGLKVNEKRPAIIFLNAIGENEGAPRVKSWGIYTTWPQLMAAKGYVGISMEADGQRIQESISGLFNFLDKDGSQFHIDTNKLGVYAASSNVSQASVYLMSEKVYKGIKAAVLYYGSVPEGPFRKDLPVLFVISEGDAVRGGYTGLWNEVLKNNAPWTVKMGTGMPHAFDAFSDNDNARKIVKETVSFWKDELDPVPQPSFPNSTMRNSLGLLRMYPAQAIDSLKLLVDRYPDNTRVLIMYAESLKQNGKSNDAKPVYQKILKLDPNNVGAMVSLAAISYGENNDAEAEKFIEQAKATGKMNQNYYGDLGFSLLTLGRDKEAAKYYEMSLENKPNAHNYYNLACAYAKFGDKEHAIVALQKAMEMGYGPKSFIEQDPDLNSIRTDERYKALIAKAK
ncbi:MAG: hypothetical protein C5B52_13900 [Bacteroidetes bacterium]|nr:MAG: hypothetical protein C5B52_13900 [Bacteroidota bacterium]